jgi:uncharacterized SAM-binding protein YcdF (DUF218 family)
MMALSAFFTTAFLSPVVFALLLAVAIALVASRKRVAALWLLGATLFCLLALSTSPVRDALLRPLEQRYPAFPSVAPGVDAIVVLGGGVLDGAPDEGGRASLSAESLKRVAYGYTLFRSFGVPVIVSGGRVWKGAGQTEAEVASTALVRLGAPPALVIMEGNSRTTWENAREVSLILRARGARRIALVTSAYHMPRAMLAFRRFEVPCIPAPTDYKVRYGATAFVESLPRFQCLTDSFTAMREYAGIVQYAARRRK